MRSWARWLFVSSALVFFVARRCHFEFPGDGAGLSDSEGTADSGRSEEHAPSVSEIQASSAHHRGDSDVLRLCGWNIQKLGHGTKKNYPLTAQIVDAHCDAIVVTEVMQKKGGHRGYDRLLVELPGWRGWITDSPRPNTRSGNAEHYAVLSRHGGLKLCEGWSGLRYFSDNDGSRGDTRADLFSREPAYGCFQFRRDEKLFDFLLGAYHATYQGGDREKIALEVQNIENVFSEMRRARPGEGDLLVVGDFNLLPMRLKRSTRAKVFTVGEGSTLRPSGSLSKNLVDHVLLWDPKASPELSEPARVLDVRSRARSPKTFRLSVSDHLPIVLDVKLRGPDDD